MKSCFRRKFVSLLALSSLLLNSFLPFTVSLAFADEATPSAEVSVTPTSVPEATPSATLIPTPSPTGESTPAPVQSDWKDNGDGSFQTTNDVVENAVYTAPQNNKVTIKFNKLPNPTGKISVKEITLSDEQVKQTGALSKTAYDISSTMQNGTFEYTLTLPTTKTNSVEVKVSEDGNNFVTVGGVTAQTDTLTITSLNHFTIFVVTTPASDTSQSVLINEVLVDELVDPEWVELYNNTAGSIDLSAGTGWVINDSLNSVQSLSALGTIPAGGRVVFDAPDGWLSNTGPETITLSDENGTVVDTVAISGSGPGFSVDHYPLMSESIGRTSDGSGEWKNFAVPTKGSANVDVTNPVLTGFTSTTASGTYGPGSNINITATFNEPLGAGSTMSVTLNNMIIVSLDSVSGGTLSGTYTVGDLGSEQNSPALSVDLFDIWPGMFVKDLSGNLLDPLDFPASNITDTKIIAIDTDAPVITLTGNTPDIEINGSYTELGATAVDTTDGSFAATPSGSVNTSVAGSYIITYNAVDTAGNSATPVTRTVNVVDSIANAFAAISATLAGNNIANNLNSVNTGNVAAFSGLYFEKSIEGIPAGRLTFTGALNLSDNATKTFLQNLGSKLDQGNGRIALNATESATFAAAGATLEMYNMMSAVTLSNLVVRNDSGAVLTTSDVVPSGSFVYDSEANKISFTANHFTQFDIDTTPPTTSDNSDGTWHNTTQTITLTCSDALPGCANTYYTTNGDTPTTSSSQGTSVVLSADGTYTLKYFSVDNAGNTESVKTVVDAVKIDKSAPTNPGTPVPSPSANPGNQNVLSWSWTAATDVLSGVSSYVWNLLNGSSSVVQNGTESGATLSVSTNITSLPDDIFTFQVKAGDSMGNFTDWVFSNPLTIDRILPAGTFKINSDATYANSHNITLNFSGVSSDVTQIEIGNGESGSYQSAVSYSNPYSYTLPLNGDGTYFVRVRFKDAAGNESTGVISDSIVVDTLAPATPVITTPVQTVNTNTIHIIGTAEANSTVTVTGGASTANGTATGGNFDITVTLTHNAVNNLNVTATDAANNTGSPATVTITHDDIAPTVTKLGNDTADIVLSTGDTSLVFSELLSTASKTAVQNALSNGADKTLTYDWSGNTLTIHATESTTFVNDVIVSSISDLVGNISSNLLLVDSKLDSTQISPDDDGDASLSDDTPEVVITNPTQPVVITVASGTDFPTIDVSSLITDGTGNIPQITINSDIADIAIPATTVTGPTDWDGEIEAPTVATIDLPSGSTLGSAIEIGFATDKLSFSNGVRILLPGQAGKKVGYSRPGTSFTEITSICSADSQAAGDALGVDGDCKIDVGSDLVIWTKHFTKFASYTQTTSSSGGSSSGNSGGGDGLSDWLSDGLGCASHDCSIHSDVTTPQSLVLASAIGFADEVLGTTSAVLGAEQPSSPTPTTIQPNAEGSDGSPVKPLAIGAIIVALFIFFAKFFIFK